MSLRSRWSLLSCLVAVVLASGCARNLPDADPADIPDLEAALADAPENPEIQTRLGVAYFRDGRASDARDQLLAAIEDGATSGAVYLYLGLSNEELENWTAARESYSEYLMVGQSGPLQDRIEERLRLIVRRQLREQAEEALALEDELSAQAPTPRSVAVLPLGVFSENPDLEPLGVALADMMITDLALSNALTVLERARVQALVDEMNMTEAGLTETTTGARAGRMLRAEHVVQGAATTVGDEELRIDADLLDTVEGDATGSVSDEDPLEQLFDIEKTIVFEILALLGVELTPAEREAIADNRAANLLAFLAYGRGLQAMDRGDFEEAAEAFGEALALDPGFARAQELGAEAGVLTRQLALDPSTLGQQGTVEFTRVASTPPPTTRSGTTLGNVDNGVNPTPNTGQIDRGSTTGTTPVDRSQNRDPVAESSGQEGRPTTTSTTIRITIPRPRGVRELAIIRIGDLLGGLR